MANIEKEIISGLTARDVKSIADQVLNRTDENHPKFTIPENGFINILQNEKPDISASSIFIRKVNL